MAYVKRARKKIKWKIVIPLVLLIIAMIYLVVTILFPRPKQSEGIQICDYSITKSASLLEKEHTEIYTVTDYFFYGETLTFLKNAYTLGEYDDIYGKTIKLLNLCNGHEVLFQLNNTIDQQIELGELENGMYEVYVISNLKEYRMVANQAIRDETHTITRQNKQKKVEVIASNTLVQDKTLSQQYVYLNIQDDEASSDYDIMIDPYGGNDDYGLGMDLGIQKNGLSENDEMYKAALVLKEKLEAYGLKVGITKENMAQKMNVSGDGGRAYKGYESKAKLFLNLQFNDSAYSETNGIEITHSAYSSAKLANQIIHDLEESGYLKGSVLYPGSIQNGTLSQLTKGDASAPIYDREMVIRETGGKATGAGSMSENMRTSNSFAKNNNKGIQTLVMRLIYVSNPMDYKQWMDHSEEIMSSIADSVAIYYQIEKEGQ